MALDYTMMRDAVNMDVMNRLTRAQGVGQASSMLGFLGADAMKQGDMFKKMFGKKPSIDEQYKNVTTPSNENFINNLKNFNPNSDLGNLNSNLTNNGTPYRNTLAGSVINNSTMMPSESTGTGTGPYGDKVYNPDNETWFPSQSSKAAFDFYTQEESPTDRALASGFQLNLKKGLDGKYTYGGNALENALEPGSGVLDPRRGGPMVNAPQDSYVVQPGDTSFDIKNKFNTTMQNLANQNFGGNLEAAKNIYPGDTLNVNPINTALSNQLTTDDNFLNENLDLFWNSGTPNDSSGAFIPGFNPIFDAQNQRSGYGG